MKPYACGRRLTWLGADAARQQNLNEEDSKKLISTCQEAFAAIGRAVAGLATSSTGANGGQNRAVTSLVAGNTANSVDVYNRQLHDDEIKLLQKPAQGKSKADQRRLVDAACPPVHCSSGLIDRRDKEKLREQERRGQTYGVEQNLLLATGQFLYGAKGYAGDLPTRGLNEAKSAGRRAVNLVT